MEMDELMCAELLVSHLEAAGPGWGMEGCMHGGETEKEMLRNAETEGETARARDIEGE